MAKENLDKRKKKTIEGPLAQLASIYLLLYCLKPAVHRVFIPTLGEYYSRTLRTL